MVAQAGNGINVLILGESQNGKSTLIKQLAAYAGLEDIEINIGDYNASSTAHVEKYTIPTVFRRYSLVDSKGKEINNRKYDELIGLDNDEASCVANEAENNGQEFVFNYFDTPGLDDSSGKDMDIMAEILGTIDDLKYINAVVYVRNYNKPFGESFKMFYDYIQRCIPMVAEGIIIIHSHYTVETAGGPGPGKKSDPAGDRKRAFQNANGSYRDRHSKMPHFFMDNEPDSFSPFAQVQSFNVCYDLLKCVSVQLPLRISSGQLKLLKTQNMRNIDMQIVPAVQNIRSKLSGKLEAEVAHAGESKKRAVRIRQELHRLEVLLMQQQSELADLDNDSSFLQGTETVAEDYTLKMLFWDMQPYLEKKNIAFESDCELTSVQTTARSGCRWLSTQMRGSRWTGTIRADLVRNLYGTATFYTTSRHKYAQKIGTLKAAIKATDESKFFHKTELEGCGNLAGKDMLAVKIGEQIDMCGRLVDVLESDTCEVAVWRKVRKLYDEVGVGRVINVRAFVKMYNADLEMAM